MAHRLNLTTPHSTPLHPTSPNSTPPYLVPTSSQLHHTPSLHLYYPTLSPFCQPILLQSIQPYLTPAHNTSLRNTRPNRHPLCPTPSTPLAPHFYPLITIHPTPPSHPTIIRYPHHTAHHPRYTLSSVPPTPHPPNGIHFAIRFFTHPHRKSITLHSR